MHAQESYSTLFVCLSVSTSLAHLAAKSLKFGCRYNVSFKPNEDGFKSSVKETTALEAKELCHVSLLI